MAYHRCANCETIWPESEIEPVVGHLEQRLLPGDTVPSGECRECGAVVHPYGAQEEFVHKGANHCPFCDSRNVMNHPINSECFGACGARVTTECHDCGNLWDEIYKLVGFEIEEPEEERPCQPRPRRKKKRKKK